MRTSIFKKAIKLKDKIIELGSARGWTEYTFKIDLLCEHCNGEGEVENLKGKKETCIMCDGNKTIEKETPIIRIKTDESGTYYNCDCKHHSVKAIYPNLLCSYVLAVFEKIRENIIRI